MSEAGKLQIFNSFIWNVTEMINHLQKLEENKRPVVAA